MSLKIIGAQVASLHRLLVAHRDEVQDSHLRLEDVFVHQDLPIALVSTLKDLIEDGTTLQGLLGEADSYTLKQFAERYAQKGATTFQAVVQDGLNMHKDDQAKRLFSMSSKFNTETFQTLSELFAINVNLVEKHQVHYSSLVMSKLALSKRLMACLDYALESHAKREKDCLMHAGVGSTSVVLDREAYQRGDGAAIVSLRQLQSALAHEESLRAACESKIQAKDAEIRTLLQERKDMVEQHEERVREQRHKTAMVQAKYQETMLELSQLKATMEDMASSATSVSRAHRNHPSTASSSTLRTQQTDDESTSTSVATTTGGKRKFTGAETSTDRREPIKKPWMGKMLDIRAHASPIPLSRSTTRISPIDVSVFDNKPPAIFTREGLKTLLGGNTRCHHVTVGPSATALAKEFQVPLYFILDAAQHPWLPTGPGRHGYCFISPSNLTSSLETAEEGHVFCAVDRTSGFNYVGKYRAQRVGALTAAEWAALPEKFHDLYGKKTSGRSQHTAEETVDLYNVGKLHVPCIRLQCIDFDAAFYERLASQNDAFQRQSGPGAATFRPKRQKRSAQDDNRYDSDCEMVESEDD